jgi:hypothetical protein
LRQTFNDPTQTEVCATFKPFKAAPSRLELFLRAAIVLEESLDDTRLMFGAFKNGGNGWSSAL